MPNPVKHPERLTGLLGHPRSTGPRLALQTADPHIPPTPKPVGHPK